MNMNVFRSSSGQQSFVGDLGANATVLVGRGKPAPQRSCQHGGESSKGRSADGKPVPVDVDPPKSPAAKSDVKTSSVVDSMIPNAPIDIYSVLRLFAKAAQGMRYADRLIKGASVRGQIAEMRNSAEKVQEAAKKRCSAAKWQAGAGIAGGVVSGVAAGMGVRNSTKSLSSAGKSESAITNMELKNAEIKVATIKLEAQVKVVDVKAVDVKTAETKLAEVKLTADKAPGIGAPGVGANKPVQSMGARFAVKRADAKVELAKNEHKAAETQLTNLKDKQNLLLKERDTLENVAKDMKNDAAMKNIAAGKYTAASQIAPEFGKNTISAFYATDKELEASEIDAQKVERDMAAKLEEEKGGGAQARAQQWADMMRDVRDRLAAMEQSNLDTNRAIVRG